MARPVGSKNKPKMTSGLEVVKFEKQIANAPVTNFNAQYDIINYGAKNDYPYKLIDLYNTSVTHRACIDFATNAIVGDGIDWEKMKINSEDMVTPNYSMSWNEFIKALAFDYCLYSAFAFQIIKNKDNKTYSFFPQPIETVRLEEMDEDGVVNNGYLCKDWTATGKYPPVKMPIFGFQEDEQIPMGQPYLVYHKTYNPVNAYYGLPTYSSALNAIQAEAAYQTWELKNVSNNFTPTGMLTLPTVETDDERRAIIRNIQEMFGGVENSNALMITFRTNIEDKPVEFTPFTAPTSNVNLYEAANERTINRIMAGHKIPSKALIGYPADDTGFSNSGEYLESAFALYNVNVANNARREILDTVNTLFKLNGVDVQIELKPLRYRIDNQEETKVETTTRPEGEEKTEEEVEERENNTI
ncbi:MAG: phage portal protein [Methanobrevibacter sp.]|nr:phage portal protein [Methanobrevibacter sp.]